MTVYRFYDSLNCYGFYLSNNIHTETYFCFVYYSYVLIGLDTAVHVIELQLTVCSHSDPDIGGQIEKTVGILTLLYEETSLCLRSDMCSLYVGTVTSI